MCTTDRFNRDFYSKEQVSNKVRKGKGIKQFILNNHFLSEIPKEVLTFKFFKKTKSKGLFFDKFEIA